ncbi:MAG: right-handed parallel beta-helix repeat-containing protein [Opitutae bacterium]|nr:right-handed parallel beta-helix repeat-containing protein [Opitutae bacterium]
MLRARDAVRDLVAKKGRPAGGVAVVLQPGEYCLREPLVLARQDGGTAAAPVTYRARRSGTAVLYGGTRITGFKLVTDSRVLGRLPDEARGKVWQCELKAQGIADYGQLYVRGFAQPVAPETLEVYVNDQPMKLARWPNQGFVRIARLVEPGSRKEGRPTVLACDTDRPRRWANAPDAWLSGYFRFLWADSTLPIGRIDPDARTIATARAYDYRGLGGADDKQGIIFYAFNLLEEIDEPGEWYLDRVSGVLYLYPPADLTRAKVEISRLAQPMIRAQEVSHVRLEGLVFDLARSNGVILADSEDCRVAGCVIRRMAGNGISILGGHRNVLLSCDVHTIGRRASEVVGGDRATLTPGGHVVENCRFHDFGRIDRTYTPGVELQGVGNRVAHCLFHDCPSTAVHIEGNDHLLEFNEVRDAVLESDDQGAMELFGNPTYRGVVFRHNLFREIGPRNPGAATVAGRSAIRFDDVISGMRVYGNVFYRASSGGFGAVQINSGRDNVIDNNLFIECRECLTGGWEESNSFWKQSRELRRLLELPAMNEVRRNVAHDCPGAWEEAGAAAAGGKHPAIPPARARPDRWNLFQNAVAPDGAVSAGVDETGRFHLHQDRAFLAGMGFQPIPIEDIGLYRDAYRRELP